MRGIAILSLVIAVMGLAQADTAIADYQGTNLLVIEPTAESLYVRPGEEVVVKLRQINLAAPVAGYQAFISFDPGRLGFLYGSYTASPYEMPIITPISAVWDAIDLAAGTVSATSSNAYLAELVFTALLESVTWVQFRAHDPESMFADDQGDEVIPMLVVGNPIVIDGTAPAVSIISAKQNGQELIGTGRNAIQGQVDIAVTASDALAGLSGPPSVTITPNGGTPEAASFINEDPSGTFNYVWNVTPAAPNGPAVINASASDAAGNIGFADPRSFNVNKTQATVTLQLGGVTESITRPIKFVIGGTGGSVPPIVITRQVPFISGSASVVFTDLPADAEWTRISAKDEQHTLRRTVPLTDVGNLQYYADMTGANSLIGGDATNDNLIDILDFGIFAGQYGTPGHPRTPPARDADFSCDREVWTEDVTFIQIYFARRGDLEPGGAVPLSEPAPRFEISTGELAALIGAEQAGIADKNGDGLVNPDDVRLFVQNAHTAPADAPSEPSPGPAVVSLELRPAYQVVRSGDLVSVRLYAVSNEAAAPISAMDVAMSYDADHLHFSNITEPPASYDWLIDGFLWPSPDGINEDLSDGQMMHSAWGQMGIPAMATRTGLPVAALEFTADGPTCGAWIDIPSSIGSARTRVFDGTMPNVDIKGALGDTKILIAPPGYLISVAEALARPDESIVTLAGPLVSRSFGSYFYIEDYSRAAGIRVNCSPAEIPPEGTNPTITGIMRTIDGERVIDQAEVGEGCAIGVPAALCTVTRAAMQGLRTSGLLLKIAGAVRSVSPGGDSFVLSDGYERDLPVELYGFSAPPVGSFVTVLGVLGADLSGPLMRVRHEQDVQVLIQ